MLKKYNKLLVLLLIVPCMFLMTACKKNKPQTQEYTITYELNGGVNNAENPEKYVSGSGSNVIFKDPSKTGYDFVGWFSDENLTNKVLGIESTMTGDVKVYADWEIATYTITYELNGGVNHADNPSSYTIETPETTLLSATKTGYTFDGWYTSSAFLNNEKVTKIEAGSSGNLILYAKYSIETYTITYELDGGVNDECNVNTYKIDSETITLLDATKSGYTFGGWYTSENFLLEERVTKIFTGSTGNMTLYAKWDLLLYSLNYHMDIGTSTVSFTIEDEITTLFAPNKEGYTFDGWYSSENYLPEEIVTKIEVGTARDVDLYAKFTPKSFKIYFEYDGADGGEMPESLDVTFDSEIESLPVPTKTDSEFMGWWKGNVKYENTTIYNTNGNLTLTAHWKDAGAPTPTYTITFVTNGGSDVEALTDIEHGSLIPEFTAPTKAGYTLEGWLFNSEFWNLETDLVTENITLTASWVLETYDIVYHLDGGVNNDLNPSSYTINSSEIVFERATKTGYVFLGWFYESTFENKATKIEAGSTGDIEIFASWRKVETGAVSKVKISYNLPDYLAHLYTDEESKRPVDSFVNLPSFVSEGISTYFEGFFYEDAQYGETLITEGSYHIVSSDDLHIYAKWNYADMEKYYYTDKLVFALDETNTFSIVKSYGDGRSSIIVIPKLYRFEGVDYEVREIGENCFLGNKNISKIFVNADSIVIAKDAFKNSSVTEFDFTKVTSIGESAFESTLINKFVPGEQLVTIEKRAFAGAVALDTVNLSGASESIIRINSEVFSNCTALKNVILKSTIMIIDSYVFAGCSSLESLEFLASIGENAIILNNAFADCTSLKTVTIPMNIASVDRDTFAGCSSLTELKLYSTFFERFTDSFEKLFGVFPIEKVEFFGNYITVVPSYYFEGITTLKEFVMCDSVLEIGEDAFYECTNLEIIVFSKSFKTETFSVNDFYGTKWLANCTDIIVIEGVVVYVPNNEGFVNVTLPAGVVAISSDAIKNNTFIETIVIPSSVKIISSDAFRNAKNLKTVTFESGSLLESLGKKAFYSCKNLESINLQDCKNLVSIGNEAFGYVAESVDDGLSLELPDSLETLGDDVFYRSNVRKVIASGENYETDAKGVLYKTETVSGKKEKVSLVFYPVSVQGEIYVIPSTVKEICSSCFVKVNSTNGSNLTYILINSDITIQADAFYSSILVLLKNNAEITYETSFGNPLDYSLTYLDESLYTIHNAGEIYTVGLVAGIDVEDNYYLLTDSTGKVFMVYISSNTLYEVIDITDYLVTE